MLSGNSPGTTIDADDVFGGPQGRTFLSNAEETNKSTKRIFDADNVAREIENRYAQGERGVTTAENLVADPRTNERLSTFPHLSLVVSATKNSRSAVPATGRLADGILRMRCVPGRVRMDVRALTDALGVDLREVAGMRDQLLFGFDPVTEILKGVSSHINVLHSFLRDVLLSLLKELGENQQSGLAFIAASECVVGIHKAIAAASEMTRKANAAAAARPRAVSSRCRCCGGQGHGAGPLIYPFMRRVGLAASKEENRKRKAGHQLPPEFTAPKLPVKRNRVSESAVRTSVRKTDVEALPSPTNLYLDATEITGEDASRARVRMRDFENQMSIEKFVERGRGKSEAASRSVH